MLSLCILKTIWMSTDKSAMIENTESPPVRNPAQLSTLNSALILGYPTPIAAAVRHHRIAAKLFKYTAVDQWVQ